jgi:GNAT superfamily N-acetyltransferase
MIRIRASRPDDGFVLRDIERSAGEAFRAIGMASVASEEPRSEVELTAYAMAGRSWVAVEDTDRPVGYILLDEIDGDAHVAQVSVLPESQGRGVGRALLEQVRIWAVAANVPAITLTTFRDVPWNRPLYEHLGFLVLPEERIGPGLRAILAHESDGGPRTAARVCMRVDASIPMIVEG